MSTTTQPPKPKRRWCRFSLKTLLVVMLVFSVTVGCAVGWIRHRQQRAQENRERVVAVEEAVAWVEELDGMVVFEYVELRPQSWLEEQFDDPGGADDPVGVLKATKVHFDFFVDLADGEIVSANFTDAGLEHLSRLTSLQDLILPGPNVTDAGLEHLKGLTNLLALDIGGANVTDAGLEHLTELRNLRSLSLDGTNVTEEGIKKLQQALPNCKIYTGSFSR